jgi:hypothetical protein
VEATMSEYDRRTGVKRLRVRGFKSVRFYATLKAAGINILRAAAVWLAIIPEIQGSQSAKIDRSHAFLIIKEHFLNKWHFLKRFFWIPSIKRAYAQKIVFLTL